MLTQTCYTVYMVNRAILLSLDAILIVMPRIFKVYGNFFAVRESAVAKSSSSNVTTAFQQHRYELCSSVRGLTKHFFEQLA